MDYLKSLIDLHETGAQLLDLLIVEKKSVQSFEQRQKEFKKSFSRTSPEFANKILCGQRKIILLSRSYSKLVKQINL